MRSPSLENTVTVTFEFEYDRLDFGELGCGVDQLSQASGHRERTSAGLELAGEIDGGNPVGDGHAQQHGVVGNGR